MTIVNPEFQLFGALGSPYSLKLRALLRYRRIPHVFIPLTDRSSAILSEVKVPLMPVLRYPDGGVKNDTTPIIRDLETRYPGHRSIVPPAPADAFLAALIEDFADEWATKWMFHYRWFYESLQPGAIRAIVSDEAGPMPRAELEIRTNRFRERQIDRMALVGCSLSNKALIEETFQDFLSVLERHISEVGNFLFGSRPSLAEFGLYGQLSQMALDPVPAALLHRLAPATWRWVSQVDDLSGCEGAWDETSPARTLQEMVAIVGRVYLPYLKANKTASERGDELTKIELNGHAFEQPPFRYHVRCLQSLKSQFSALDARSRKRVTDALASSEAERILLD